MRASHFWLQQQQNLGRRFYAIGMHLGPLVAWLLSILKRQFCCYLSIFYAFLIVCGDSVFVFVLLCITVCPFYFCNCLEEEEHAGCFAFVVLPMSC